MKRFVLAAAVALGGASTAPALFIDGEGHYGIRGEYQAAPGVVRDKGTHQAVEQSFRLGGEFRLSDKASFLTEFRLFGNPREAYWGHDPDFSECPAEGCQHANSFAPAYKPLMPRVTKAYVRYGFDYFMLEAGRRGRDWGLGALLSDGSAPFAVRPSVFDGVTLHVNLQKAQTIGFAVGFDKIGEAAARVPTSDSDSESSASSSAGASSRTDDLDQYFLSVEYDDTKVNSGAYLTKAIGIYAAQVRSAPIADGGSSTSMTFVDLYTHFHIPNLVVSNEFVMRLGKTGDPHSLRYGGALGDNGKAAVNSVDSLTLVGEVAWTVASDGRFAGPPAFGNGDRNRHVVFAQYAYVPGDEDGYYSSTDSASPAALEKRSTKARAMALHHDYSPALILFRGHSETDDLAVDGIYANHQVMNTFLMAAGYRYESLQHGNLEAKMILGSLLDTVPSGLKDHYAGQDHQPIGTHGSNLGLELDVRYEHRLTERVTLGAAAGLLFPGKAWQTKADSNTRANYLVQSHLTFAF